jgi:predicted metal-binding protein
MTTPTCQHSHATASTALVQDHTVWLCRECRSVRLDGSDQWLSGGSGVIDQLRRMAGQVDQARSNEQEMMTSDISDPRWTRLDETG